MNSTFFKTLGDIVSAANTLINGDEKSAPIVTQQMQTDFSAIGNIVVNNAMLKAIEEESVANGELIVSNKFSKVSGHLKSLEDKYGIINSAYLLTGFNDVNNFELRSISYDKEKGTYVQTGQIVASVTNNILEFTAIIKSKVTL